MADYAPPPGPPPPHVPDGWVAKYNEQYKEWFYVNIHTKQSQWDKPTQPVYATPQDGAPAGPPPGYDHSRGSATGPEKGGLGSNNPYNGSTSMSEDERLARQLQAEEEARAKHGGSADRGASDSYYQGGGTGQYGQQNAPYGQQQSPSSYGQQPDQTRSKGGFFSKISNKLGGSSSSRPPQQYQQPYPQQQGYGGGGYGGGYPPQQQYYPPQQQGYYGQQPRRQGGGGLGAGGGALLGAGAGLVGGALLMDAIDDHDQEEYQQGYDAGGGGDDYGNDDGGGDDGGGD